MLYHRVMYLLDVPHAYAQSSDINAIASADQAVFLANHGDSINESRGNQSFSRQTDSQEQQEEYAALIAEAEAYGARVESSGTIDGYQAGEEVNPRPPICPLIFHHAIS